jgi:hypothetical protein
MESEYHPSGELELLCHLKDVPLRVKGAFSQITPLTCGSFLLPVMVRNPQSRG